MFVSHFRNIPLSIICSRPSMLIVCSCQIVIWSIIFFWEYMHNMLSGPWKLGTNIVRSRQFPWSFQKTLRFEPGAWSQRLLLLQDLRKCLWLLRFRWTGEYVLPRAFPLATGSFLRVRIKSITAASCPCLSWAQAFSPTTPMLNDSLHFRHHNDQLISSDRIPPLLGTWSTDRDGRISRVTTMIDVVGPWISHSGHKF